MVKYKTLKEWNPDAKAERYIDVLITSDGSNDKITHKFEYYRGNKLPLDILNDLLNITKDNMKSLYDTTQFYGGWDDSRKISEFKFYKTHIILIRSGDNNNNIVGFITFRFLIMRDNQPPTPVCYIYELQVIEDYQSSGIGSYLINLLLDISRNVSCSKLMCTVLKTNTRAVSFYRNKCNFVNDESDDSLVNYHILKLII